MLPAFPAAGDLGVELDLVEGDVEGSSWDERVTDDETVDDRLLRSPSSDTEDEWEGDRLNRDRMLGMG